MTKIQTTIRIGPVIQKISDLVLPNSCSGMPVDDLPRHKAIAIKPVTIMKIPRLIRTTVTNRSYIAWASGDSGWSRGKIDTTHLQSYESNFAPRTILDVLVMSALEQQREGIQVTVKYQHLFLL